MKYFVGTYDNKIDNKGRVSLPAPFRDILTEGNGTAFYIFPSPNHDALEAGGSDLMEFIAKSIEDQAPMFSEEENTLNYIMASARLVSCDSTGRFVLPAQFASFANINSSATFVGKSRRFQIWSSSAYQSISSNGREKFAQSKLTIKKPVGYSYD